MTDQMKNQTAITRHDAEHLENEALRVAHDLVGEEGFGVAMGVYRVAYGIRTLAQAAPLTDAWQQLLAESTLDSLLPGLSEILATVDPAKAVA